jgi:hypothetical protein
MAVAKKKRSFAVKNDLEGKSAAEIEAERKVMKDRAARVRRRLTMNASFLSRAARAVKEGAKN